MTVWTNTSCARCNAQNFGVLFCHNCGLYLPDETATVERVTYNRRFLTVLLESTLTLVTLVIGWYIWLAFTAPTAQTPAKRMVNVFIIDADTHRAITAGRVWVRELLVKGILLAIVGIFTAYIASLANALWPFFDKNRQALHDKVVNTVVVYAPLGLPESMQPPAAGAYRRVPSAQLGSSTVAEQLRELARLHDEKVLTDDEYERKRSELAAKL